MERFQDRQVLCKILHESILQMCKVSVGLHSNITIDGIICIANEEDDREIIVKIHEQVERNISELNKPPASSVAEAEKLKNLEIKQPSRLEEAQVDKPFFQDKPRFMQSHSTTSDKDFIYHDDNELFGDLTAIKAITPLNRND